MSTSNLTQQFRSHSNTLGMQIWCIGALPLPFKLLLLSHTVESKRVFAPTVIKLAANFESPLTLCSIGEAFCEMNNASDFQERLIWFENVFISIIITKSVLRRGQRIRGEGWGSAYISCPIYQSIGLTYCKCLFLSLMMALFGSLFHFGYLEGDIQIIMASDWT